MTTFLVQIKRGDEWRLLTSVRAVASSPSDEVHAIQRARAKAGQQLFDWSLHFHCADLRIAEAV